MQPKKNLIRAVWVKFSPYLVKWAENEFGTGVILTGKKMLELRTVEGMKELFREAVEEDATLSKLTGSSLSQLRYEVMRAEAVINSVCFEMHYGMPATTLDTYLPVHVPEYLQVIGGAIRPFSRIMQMTQRTASLLSKKVYHEFWKAVHDYASSGEFDSARDMIESFCEENDLGELHIDDLRNQYQRLVRRGFFVK